MKQIPDFPDYFINEIGEVWSKSFHPKKNKNCELKKLKISKHKLGYLFIDLFKNGKRYNKKIHRLVAITFILNPNNLPQVNHINGIKTDNRLENLEWCDRSYNIQHAYDIGLKKQTTGEEHGSSKLTESQVLEIREKYKTGEYTQKQLGKEYGISQMLISCIVNYKRWKHI